MAFSLFGKKPAGSKPEEVKASEAPAAPARGSSPPRRLGGVADYFASGEGPGRFGTRAAKRTLPSSGVTSSAYKYGSEVPQNSVEAIAETASETVESATPTLAPWRNAAPTTTHQGAMTEAAFTQLPSHIDMGEVPRRAPKLAEADMPQALEDCALSFANGEVSEALRVVEDAIREQALGEWGVKAWLMRFDLYEHLGLKAAFEAQALTFATLFERSPPVWRDDRGAEPARAAAVPRVHITGALSAASAAPLSALRKTVERYSGVRLDFSRIESCDKDGARYLLVTIQSLKRAGKTVEIMSDESLLALLRPSIQAGNRATEATTWLLYLEVLQLADRPAEFESVAIQYATTFEVSPPSWQTVASARVMPLAEPATEARFELEGEIVSPVDRVLDRLEQYAKDHTLIVVDLARTKRIDFVACSQITNALSKLRESGHSVELRAPSEMVAALLGLMGASDFGRIVPRRG